MSSVRSMKNFRRSSCERVKCPLQSSYSGCLSEYYKEGVIYLGTCTICEEAGTKSVYIGESSRTLYTRVEQHHRDFTRARNKPETVGADEDTEISSWIIDHMRDKHWMEEVDNPEDIVRFSILSSHKDPFTRQTVEAVRINEALDRGNFKLERKQRKLHL